MKVVESAKAPRVWQPIRQLAGRITVDFELARPVLAMRPGYLIKGERINDLSPLPPETHFRAAMLRAARLFVDDLIKKPERYHLETPEADMLIYGPYQHRSHSGVAVGFEQDEWLFPEAVDFQIVGDFVAEFGKNVEHGASLDDVPDDQRAKVMSVSFERWKQVEAAAMERARRNG